MNSFLSKHNFIVLSFGLILLIGCSQKPKEKGSAALFDTKIEAEEAAKNFNCTGAHKMGEKWMPCNEHSSHTNHHHH